MSTRDVVTGLSSEMTKGSCQPRVIVALVPSAEGSIVTLSGSPWSRRQWNSSGRPFGSRVSAAETVIVRVAAFERQMRAMAPGVSKSCSERPSPK